MYRVEIQDGNTLISHDGIPLGRVQRLVIEVNTTDFVPHMHLDVILTPAAGVVVAEIADDNVTVVATQPEPGAVHALGVERGPVDFVPPSK
jgi:hypothetical protein